MTFGPKKTKKQLMKNTGAVKGKLSGANTIDYVTADGTRKIRYHETDVLTFRHDGTVEFNSGGYRTPTTKARINDNQDLISVYQQDGIWYYNATAPGGWRKNSVFFDGMIIDQNGRCINPDAGADDGENKKRIAKLIKDYCRAFQTLERLPDPHESAGDCFYCNMRTESGAPLGDEIKDKSHLVNHLEHHYFMFSLTWNALIDSGRSEEAAAYIYRTDIRDLITSAIRSYFKKRLSIGR